MRPSGITDTLLQAMCWESDRMVNKLIKVKMPVLFLSISGEYSRFKKPAGLENLVLTAIGTPALREDTWREFFGRLAIPEKMAPLFEQVLDDLFDNDVIDTNIFNIDDAIKYIQFTETGRDLFEQGRVKQSPNSFSEDVYFIPYSKYDRPKYAFEIKSSDANGFDSGRFQDLQPDMDEVRKFLTENKKHIGADAEDEILSVELDCEPQLICSEESVELEFDETSGDFTFGSEMDPNFIKGYFNADDFIKHHEILSSLPSGVILKAVTDVPEDWESYKYHVPADFSFKGKLGAYDPKLCEIGGKCPIESLGYHFVDISSYNSGRGYILTTKKTTVLGLNGESEFRVLVSRPLPKEFIAEILAQCIKLYDISDYEDLQKILALSDISSEASFETSWIIKHLEQSKDLVSSVNNLKKDYGKLLRNNYPIIEEAAALRNMGADDLVKLLRATELKIPCTRICDHLASGKPAEDLLIFDQLLPVCNEKPVLAAKMNLKNEMVSMILSGNTGAFSSQELIALNSLTNSFRKLKEIFAVTSTKDYDLSKVDESRAGEVSTEYSLANKSMSVLSDIISGAERLPELQSYLNLFQDLSEIYSKEVPLHVLIGYQFGIGIRREMETLLRKMLGGREELVQLIDHAAKEGIIAKDVQDLFHKIRIYGNDCAHTSDVPLIDSKTKKEWISAIDNLKKNTEKVMKK